MTGQVIVEFDGRAIPKITFKGGILPINMRMVDRFLRKAYRIHCYELQKTSAAAKKKPAVTTALKPGAVIDLPKPAIATKLFVADQGMIATPSMPAAPISKVGISPAVTQQLSEDKKNDQKRDAGDAKGPRRNEGTEKAKLGGAGRPAVGHQGR